MSAFRVQFLPSAAKDYRQLDPPIQSRLLKAFETIARDPDAGKPLQGPYRGLRSYRVGDYRIVYRSEPSSKTALIHRIGHRRDVYRQ